MTQISPHHETRQLLLKFPAIIFSLYSAFVANDALYAVVIAGLIFRLTANPSPIGYNGWLSVRGLISGSAALLSIGFNILFLATSVFAPANNNTDEKPGNEDSKPGPGIIVMVKEVGKLTINILLGMFPLPRCEETSY